MKDLIIIGAGGFGRELLSYLTDAVEKGQNEWQIKGFIDDNLKAFDKFDIDCPILGPIQGHEVEENSVYICSIADSKTRLKVCRELQEKGATFINFFHPTVKIRERVTMGVGNIFSPLSYTSTDILMGDFIIVNYHSTIAHDCTIGDACTISANCEITGNCKLGEGVFLGARALITPNRRIGDYAKIGAGAVVFTHVKPGKTMIGNPAMVLK